MNCNESCWEGMKFKLLGVTLMPPCLLSLAHSKLYKAIYPIAIRIIVTTLAWCRNAFQYPHKEGLKEQKSIYASPFITFLVSVQTIINALSALPTFPLCPFQFCIYVTIGLNHVLRWKIGLWSNYVPRGRWNYVLFKSSRIPVQRASWA